MASESSEINEFEVTIARNCGVLTRCKKLFTDIVDIIIF
jgi:hypothetical protein